jgi:hypothetical protein
MDDHGLTGDVEQWLVRQPGGCHARRYEDEDVGHGPALLLKSAAKRG